MKEKIYGIIGDYTEFGEKLDHQGFFGFFKLDGDNVQGEVFDQLGRASIKGSMVNPSILVFEKRYVEAQGVFKPIKYVLNRGKVLTNQGDEIMAYWMGEYRLIIPGTERFQSPQGSVVCQTTLVDHPWESPINFERWNPGQRIASV